MRVDGATAPSAPGAFPPPTPPQQSYQKLSDQEQNHEIPIGIFRGPDREEAYSYRQVQRIQQSIAMSRSSNTASRCESTDSGSIPETESSSVDREFSVIIRTRSCANAEDPIRSSRALSEVISTSSIRPLEEFSKLVSEMPKSKSCYEYRRRGGVRHRDAEEALSSLLWQPYECRAPLHGAESGGASGIGIGISNGRMLHSLVEPRYGESCVSTMRLNVPPAPTPASADDSQVSSVSVNGEVLTNQTNSACVQVHQPRSWTTSAAQTDDVVGDVGVVQLDNEHRLPPPYSTLPPPVHAAHRIGPPPPPPPAPPHPIPVQPHAYPFQPVTLRRCQYGEDSEDPKTCCGGGGGRLVSLRWFIVAVALAGVCCVLVGAVLGAAGAQGRGHLTVLLLMICIGFVLIFVSGAAWRAISKRARSRARSGSLTASSPPRRLPSTSCARAHHPYAAMLYPEFHCRPPPPSYQASMHEYRLSRLLLLDRGASPPMACPPPPYRPRPRGIVGGGPQYLGGRGARSRRRPEPRESPPALSAVVIQNIGLEQYDEVKYDDSQEVDQPIGSDRKEEEVQQEHKEGNLVTIVQTGQDTSPVIVTVSGSIPESRPNQAQHTSEIDILAHL